jgi:hypothetical protein
MPVPTAPEYIDRASGLIRAAVAADSEDEQIRLLQDAEACLQLAKQLLVRAKAKVDSEAPKP